MSRALEIRPLLVAAGIGALIFWGLNRDRQAAITGALFGAAVQLGVRLAGVS